MKVYLKPYRHIRCSNFLSPNEYDRLVEHLPRLKWELYDKGNYCYKVSSLDYETEYYRLNKEIIEKFISTDFIARLSDILEIKFEKCKDFTFHKMEIGDFSFKHTDKNKYGEIGRIVYYLTEPENYEGGNLKLYGFNGKEVSELLKMRANSFFSFRLTDKFYHEVETITKGVRYCISITYK